MKQKIALFLTFIAAISVFIACNNNDDNTGGTNPILGTWKLVEEYSNGSAVSLSTCELAETWIFGPEQFTHELYENGGKPAVKVAYKSALGDDDEDSDEDEGDDHSDESSDDEDDSSDDTTNPATGTTDDSSDDTDDSIDDGGTGGSGNCVNSDRIIGYWTSNNGVYTFTVDTVSDVKVITFTDANNGFYIETTATVNGTTVMRRYVFQKQ